MASQFTLIQSAANTSTTTSVTATFTYSAATNNLLYATVFANAGTIAMSGWTLVARETFSGTKSVATFRLLSSGGTGVTATATGATAMTIDVYEFAGNANPLALDGTANTSGSSTAVTTLATGTITTTVASSMVLVSLGIGTTGLTSPTWTTSTLIGSSTRTAEGSYLPGTALTNFSDTANWTSPSGTAGTSISAFKASTIGVIQRTYGTSISGNTTANFPETNTTAGNAIVVVAFINANVSNLSISDSQGNSYVSINSNYNLTDVLGFEAWIAYNIVGGTDTITVSNGGNPTNIQVWELSGVPTAGGAVDDSAFAYQAAATSLSSGNITTTDANDALLAASVQISGSGSYSAGSGFVNLLTGSSLTLTSAQEEKIVASAGTYAGTFSLGTNVAYTCTVIIAISSTTTPSVSSWAEPTSQPSNHYFRTKIEES